MNNHHNLIYLKALFFNRVPWVGLRWGTRLHLVTEGTQSHPSAPIEHETAMLVCVGDGHDDRGSGGDGDGGASELETVVNGGQLRAVNQLLCCCHSFDSCFV